MTTPAPTTIPGHPDYEYDCQEAIEAEFLALACHAEAAGWDPHVVASALRALTFMYDRGLEPGDDVDQPVLAFCSRQLH
jgi:hypothetical protein